MGSKDLLESEFCPICEAEGSSPEHECDSCGRVVCEECFHSDMGLCEEDHRHMEEGIQRG